MQKHYSTILFVLILLLSLCDITVAQNEIGTQRKSLEGLQQFYFTVNVEAPANLADKKALDVTRLKKKSLQTLRRADLPVKKGKTPKGQQHAMLIMHVNAMDAGRGIVPFAVNLDLYQPVKLTLNRDLSHTASTWNTGNVGVVSLDNLSMIPDAATGLLDDIIRDYRAANNSTQ